MRDIYSNLVHALNTKEHCAFATIIEATGSTPQVQGASAVFSVAGGLAAGTLGGGILEGKAHREAIRAIETRLPEIFEYTLKTDVTSEEGALCGGNVMILIDPLAARHRNVFTELGKSLSDNKPGVMATFITGNDHSRVEITRMWIEASNGTLHLDAGHLQDYQDEVLSCLQDKSCRLIEVVPFKSGETEQGIYLFLQPVYPMPKLIVAGAGHVGKALTHLASLLDFEVTVIDDRKEYANPGNLPDAHHIIMKPVGKAMEKIDYGEDTYVVIVTHGHRDDADALRACIRSGAAYIGMIGSKRKIRVMRDEFLEKGWAYENEFDRVFAPIGLEIHSKTVQEIALSISAQLVQVRHQQEARINKPGINALILAAGESKRMGQPKMLMPYGEATIIEQIIKETINSLADSIHVVTGADAEKIVDVIRSYPVSWSLNEAYSSGMISSVQCGIKNLKSATAILILLGDQPMISVSVIDKLITSYFRSGKGIIQATYQGKRGHPVIIDKKYFSEILGLKEGKNLRDLIRDHPGDTSEVDTGSPEILRDIDTIEDYHYEIKNIKNHE